MSFRSHQIKLTFVNEERQDIRVESMRGRHLKGTEVTFRVSRKIRRVLADVFREFAPEEYEFRFEATHMLVRLFCTEYVSRSEGKRLVAGLDKFRKVTLDLSGVRSIGQGFADEVFRVFQRAHPEIDIEVVHAISTVEAMIQHVVGSER